MKPLKPWKYFWSLITFRPGIYIVELLCILVFAALTQVPAFLLRDFFNHLNTPAGPNLWWLVVLLLMSLITKLTAEPIIQITYSSFIVISDALVHKNVFARILELPGARTLPASSGEAVN